MTYDRERHRRRSIRLVGYDYGQAGSYFVTVCTQDRAYLFGDVVVGEMRLNGGGRIVEQCWLEIPRHFPDVELDAFVVMPNHVHGIIVISVAEDVGAKNLSPVQDDAGGVGAKDFSPRRSPSRTIGSIVRGFKIGVTKWFRQNTDISVVWQRNYYEHIIRNGESMNTIQEYITGNPAQWDWDRENLAPARRVAPVAGNEPWRV